MDDLIQALYIVAFSLFIVGLRMLRGPRTAVRGNQVAAVGMAIAVIATLLDDRIGDWPLIAVGIAVGTAVGVPAARNVKMTAMPQMVALFNGVGGGAAALVALLELHDVIDTTGDAPWFNLAATAFTIVVGSVSFAGSIVTFAKLQDLMTSRPVVFPGLMEVQRTHLRPSAGDGRVIDVDYCPNAQAIHHLAGDDALDREARNDRLRLA